MDIERIKHLAGLQLDEASKYPGDKDFGKVTTGYRHLEGFEKFYIPVVFQTEARNAKDAQVAFSDWLKAASRIPFPQEGSEGKAKVLNHHNIGKASDEEPSI